MDKLDIVLKIESIALQFDRLAPDEIKFCRTQVRELLLRYVGLENDGSLSLSDTIEKIAKNGERECLRYISLIVLRLLSVPHFFPKGSSENNAETKIIHLMDREIGDLYRRFDINKSAQTYEKFESLFKIHVYCCEKLRCLSQCSPNMETISAQRQMILRSIGDETVKSYLSPYEFPRIRGAIEAILSQAVDFSNTSDSTFTQRLKDLSDLLSEEAEYCDGRMTFVTKNYYRPFVIIVEQAVHGVARRLKERFVCEIVSRKGISYCLDKRYPLHIEGNEIRFPILLTNTGPGIADQTKCEINAVNDDVLIVSEVVELGGIPSGDFVVPVSAIICDSLESFTINIIVSWLIIGEMKENLLEVCVRVDAQPSNIDWDSLGKMNPYSLDIAVGENFYGRKDKIKKIYSRISQERISSSYISGQRRVGKSSLAKAVEDKISTLNPDMHVLNIECGEFKHPTAEATVSALGESIEYFLCRYLPSGLTWSSTEMNGSLAPLSRLLSSIEKFEPKKKFIIIIDEFDEINQDLYRNSEMAQTFFLNLRSLSGKSNLCFILIGAEKMSFVMSSQGEKLNKFENISLDSFSQDSEWQDYEDLIRVGTKDSLVWHDNSVRLLYGMTNGHPYFTKQICSKVFEIAVRSRDSEITNEEIDAAVDELIVDLDVNAFQHFWRDGIQGSLEEIEIVALKRCRVLVGLARAKRLGLKSTADNIVAHIHSAQLRDTEVLPILTDFCRRKILVETDQGYRFLIPFFERWLINQGFNHIISDQLGDELLEKRQQEEDAAYVQDAEINELAYRFSTYRGLAVTPHLIRVWLSQVDNHKEQRVLFKLLRRLRFFSDSEIRAAFKELHDKIRLKIPVYIRTSKAQRRKDVLVTYVDGPGKSGAQFCSLYAEENLISTSCIKEISEINSWSEKGKPLPEGINTIVIVDDFIGTGRTLVDGITMFYEKNKSLIIQSNVSVFVVVIAATSKGELLVRQKLSDLDSEADLQIHEFVGDDLFAFSENSRIWDDKSELFFAKDLCQRLGVKIDKQRPLGYGGEGLLVVFSRNCPNNTLPIIHSRGRGENSWNPLFERVKH